MEFYLDLIPVSTHRCMRAHLILYIWWCAYSQMKLVFNFQFLDKREVFLRTPEWKGNWVCRLPSTAGLQFSPTRLPCLRSWCQRNNGAWLEKHSHSNPTYCKARKIPKRKGGIYLCFTRPLFTNKKNEAILNIKYKSIGRGLHELFLEHGLSIGEYVECFLLNLNSTSNVIPFL